MGELEFVERLEADSAAHERWLVRAGDAYGIAWVVADEDPDALRTIAEGTAPWVGFAHPRVTCIRSAAWLDPRRLVVATDDDRGPTLRAAAAQLTDPHERECWTVAQVIALADALAAMRAHRPDFIHRRLAPGTMFVDASGHARLRAPIATVTAGASRAYVGAGRISGTLRWMSPEQVRGQDVTSASDVFALASNLAYALTGCAPFARDNELASAQAIVHEPAPPVVTYAPGLAEVLARAFAKDCTARPRDAGTFADELRACAPEWREVDAVISDRIAAWWPTSTPIAPAPPLLADGRCTRRWDDLTATGDPEIRHCGACDQPVVRVQSPAAIVPLVGRACVAYRDRS